MRGSRYGSSVRGLLRRGHRGRSVPRVRAHVRGRRRPCPAADRARVAPVESLARAGPRFDVVGIGNALVDVIAHADDAFLAEHELVKGSMDADRHRPGRSQLYRALGSAVEMSGGSAANTMCGVASFGGRAAYIGKVVRRRPRRRVRPRPARRRRRVPPGRARGRHADRPLHHRRHARRPAHDEHLPRRVEPAVARRPRRGGDRRRRGALHGGLPVRPRRRQGGVPPRGRRRPRRTAARCRSRCRDSFCVDRHRDDFAALVARRGRHPVRQRATSCARCTRSTRSTTPSPRCATSASSRRSPRGKDGSYVVIGRRRRRRCRPSRSTGCSTRRAPATSTRPASSTATPAARPLAECGRLGSIAAAEVISHVGPRPLVELRTLLP